MPMIFFNIGWMLRYQGVSEADKIEGNHEFIKENQSGHEQFNFMPLDGMLYGYAPTKWHGLKPEGINLERLGAPKDSEYLDGVTVVYFARNPQNNIPCIVGWYKNAVLYRFPVDLPGRVIDGLQFSYNCKTSADYGVCVPASKRVFEIPYSRSIPGGYGMSATWFADNLPGFQEKTAVYLEDYEYTVNRLNNLGKKEINIENKLLVKANAVRAVCKYYETLGFSVMAVEDQNMGWDLTAKNIHGVEYLIAVKGQPGAEISAQLTPNEYKTLRERPENFILAICAEVLTDPAIHIFSIIREENAFYGVDDDGNIIDFAELPAAAAKIRQ